MYSLQKTKILQRCHLIDSWHYEQLQHLEFEAILTALATE